jgi:hypothetical protein
VQQPYQRSAGFTGGQRAGIQFLCKGKWKPRKHRAEWRKARLGVDTPTQEGQAVERNLRGATVPNAALRTYQRLGWSIWTKWSGYRRRSMVETKMHCFKRLGDRVMARTFEHRVTELHVRVALLNRFTQLGRPIAMPVAAVA